MKQTQFSIVVPVYNERDNLEPLLGEIREAMRGTSWEHEIVLIDDASSDGSQEILRRMASEDPTIRVLIHRRNAGQSAALDSGFRAAHGGIIVTLDADLQNDPADIPQLLEQLADCDVVSGKRVDRHDSWLRRLSGRVANAVRARVTGDSITDIGCAMKAFRAAHVRRIPMFVGLHRFLPALIELRGGRVREMAVRHRPRAHGASKYGLSNRAWRAFVDLLAVQWMRSRWIDADNATELTVTPARPAGDGRAGERGAEPLPAEARPADSR